MWLWSSYISAFPRNFSGAREMLLEGYLRRKIKYLDELNHKNMNNPYAINANWHLIKSLY